MIALWLALAAEPDVDYYVMAADVDVGEVVKLVGGGYAVRLDGLDGGDIMFEASTLRDVLREAEKRLQLAAAHEDRVETHGFCCSSLISSRSSSVIPSSSACSAAQS